MFSKWLNTDKLASWDKLIKAVRIVQLNNVANDIGELLLHGEYVVDHFNMGIYYGVAQCGIGSNNTVCLYVHSKMY